MTHTTTTTHIDPVCGMTVDPTKNKGGSFEHAGTTYYFCSPGCNTKFQADPEGWLEKRRQKDLLAKASKPMIRLLRLTRRCRSSSSGLHLAISPPRHLTISPSRHLAISPSRHLHLPDGP
jgi:YHS domain-containing protein